ncbi:exodeoxyribonuclease V subunit alpha [Halomonas sp. V046]|uniref:exodeoxyribonuclease V subunit alpha n=1 Tax=Halomonas sp. V046 TaxID=3459611 RepID=UPI00404463C9
MTLFDLWVARGWLRELDRAFAAFLHQQCPDANPALLLAAALASHQLGRGHVCLDLARTLAAPDLALSLPPEGDSLEDPPPLPSRVLGGLDAATWSKAIEHPELCSHGPGMTPLVIRRDDSGTRLYLRRYWRHESSIRARIRARLGTPPADPHRLVAPLERLFPAAEGLDWQRQACALAARSPFAVITGGPGTGKTTTVVKLLALLQTLALADTGQALRIRLAAPTGKAAARLNESIAGQVERLSLDGLGEDAQTLRAAIPTAVVTLHRLLGSRPDTRRLRHHADNPLALDVLVVDEASMVDVEMMAALLEALPARARLVLLGDKDQLASVEAGAVLGDLCARAEGGHYRIETADWLASATSQRLPAEVIDAAGHDLDQAIAMLRVSHRFDADSGIGQLAAAVNAASGAPSLRGVLRRGYADLSLLDMTDVRPHPQGSASRSDSGSDLGPAPIDRRLERLVSDGLAGNFPRAAAPACESRPTGYRHYLATMSERRPAPSADAGQWDEWARAVLGAHGHFQLLCALRRGPWGVEGLNLRVRQALVRGGWLDANAATLTEDAWYEGRPVLVTRNDYGLGLMNGDIGIALSLPHPEHAGRTSLRVAFPAGDGTSRIRWVLPSRLRRVETVFAMTVHKSQGSEFLHTALVLPSAPNPILTRELVYTGITRARHWLTLVETGRGILDQAVKHRVARVSGLGWSARG